MWQYNQCVFIYCCPVLVLDRSLFHFALVGVREYIRAVSFIVLSRAPVFVLWYPSVSYRRQGTLDRMS